jgi:hypothetical protein
MDSPDCPIETVSIETKNGPIVLAKASKPNIVGYVIDATDYRFIQRLRGYLQDPQFSTKYNFEDRMDWAERLFLIDRDKLPMAVIDNVATPL